MKGLDETKVCSNMSIKLYSFRYLDEEELANVSQWSVYPSTDVWRRLMSQREESQRWIARLGESDMNSVLIGMSNPVEMYSRETLYCPKWVLDALGVEGNGERVVLEWIACETIPRATRLVVRPSRRIPDGIDPRDLMEGPLSQLGGLKMGTVLPLPGGDEGETLVVEVCEPAEEVFLDGNEIALELNEMIKDVDVNITHSTEKKTSSEEETNDMISPSYFLAQARADRENRANKTKTFIPFSGEGNRLDGKKE